MSKTVTRIAIIGAGSSGLAQLKQLLDAFARPHVSTQLEVVLFESRSEIGGVWFVIISPPHTLLWSDDSF